MQVDGLPLPRGAVAIAAAAAQPFGSANILCARSGHCRAIASERPSDARYRVIVPDPRPLPSNAPFASQRPSQGPAHARTCTRDAHAHSRIYQDRASIRNYRARVSPPN